jgi:hypothetical protein
MPTYPLDRSDTRIVYQSATSEWHGGLVCDMCISSSTGLHLSVDFFFGTAHIRLFLQNPFPDCVCVHVCFNALQAL